MYLCSTVPSKCWHQGKVYYKHYGDTYFIEQNLVFIYSYFFNRVRLILDYVKAIESGELPMNHEILREAKALANRSDRLLDMW